MRNLGKGSFGKVKLALHSQTSEDVAIKILEKSMIKKDEDMTRIRREIDILSKVRHPYVVQLYEVVETPNYFFFVMEFAEHGELSDYIERKQRLSEEESAKYFKQIIITIKYLHSIGCAHRDIKPSNILIDWRYDAKLIDFGLGNQYVDNEKLKTSCGSPCYAAPEIVAGEQYDPLMVDVWSSGITLFAMLCGFLPFDEESKTVLYDKILACKFPIPKYLSTNALDLIKRILVRDPANRLTVDEILNHPWLKIASQVKEPQPFTLDKDILNLVCRKIGASPQSLATALLANEHNDATTVYYLLKRKKDKGEQISDLSRPDTLAPPPVPAATFRPITYKKIASVIKKSMPEGVKKKRLMKVKDITLEIKEKIRFTPSRERKRKSSQASNSSFYHGLSRVSREKSFSRDRADMSLNQQFNQTRKSKARETSTSKDRSVGAGGTKALLHKMLKKMAQVQIPNSRKPSTSLSKSHESNRNTSANNSTYQTTYKSKKLKPAHNEYLTITPTSNFGNLRISLDLANCAPRSAKNSRPPRALHLTPSYTPKHETHSFIFPSSTKATLSLSKKSSQAPSHALLAQYNIPKGIPLKVINKCGG